MKYRKKPVVIEAVKWTGNNLREVIDFTGLHPSANKWTWEQYEQVVKDQGLKIFTLEGTMMAGVGDWIIKVVKGEFYPCKPDIFEKTYEAVSSHPEQGEQGQEVSFLAVLEENYEAAKKMVDEDKWRPAQEMVLETYEDLISIFKAKYK